MPHVAIKTGRRVRVLGSCFPALSFSADVPTTKATSRSWKAWLEPIEQHGLSPTDS